MGNSIQKKKKVQTEGNFSRSPSVSPKREKTKGLWLFGRQDKKKTAGPKTNEDQKRLTVHYTTAQHYQENVFIEGSRPQYLEDLHTEAQEGLKILQQEEHKNGVNFPDSESVASTDTLRPEQDISSKDRVFSPESRSTTGSTDATVTSVSTRPVLTRQGSTFKPLNPVKRLDRSKKRSRRTTIMGIPNQVQKELALQRTSTFQQLVPSEPLNHDGQVRNSQSTVLIIPTVDGGTPVTKREGARVHLSELEQAVSRDEQLLTKHLQAMNQDQQPLSQYFGPFLCPTSNVRPKSLAVPGMTTSLTFSSSTMLSFLQEPQGPVMSISPQATYLSTIIPNAVLPASVEVIEIDRSCSRTHGSSINHGGSVRTVSKSSLASVDFSVSPSLSRRLDGDGSQAESSHNSNLLPKSDSGSNWSELQSPNTITMHSSPVSSKGSTHSASSQRSTPNGQEIQTEPPGGGNDSAGLHSSVSMSSSKSENAIIGQGCESGTSGLVVSVDDGKNRHNVTRSLSVMKTKQPPAPPRRTNSLHGNKIRSNSRVLVESKDLNESVSGKMANDAENTAAVDGVTAGATKIPVSTSNSAGTITQDASASSLIPKQASSKVAEKSAEHKSECTNSSPQKTPSEGGKFERTMSPSSGYSSQSGTPTLSPKGITPTSPEKQKKPPVKPDRSVSRASSSAASPSPSLTSLSSGTSETVTGHVSVCSPSPPPQETSPNVPIKEPTPKSSSSNLGAEVRELLSIPPPPKVKAPCPPPPEIWVHNRRSFELLCGSCPNVSKGSQKPAETQDSAVKQAGTQTESSCEIQVLDEKLSPVMGGSEDDAKTETLIETAPNVVQKELMDIEHPVLQQDNTEALVDTQKQEDSSQDVKLPERQETTPKKEPPPVMKKPTIHREDTVSKEPLVNTQPSQISSSATPEADLPVKNSAALSSDEITMDKTKNENNRELPTMQTLSVEAPKFSKTSPPPTPPPAYHPTPPLSRKTPTSSVSSPPDDLEKVQEENLVTESSWPPPPPPMEGDSVFDGGEEADFPPPPPPDVSESVPKVMDSCVIEVDLTRRPSVKTGDTIEDVKAETSEHEQTPNVPPVVSQGISDTKPGVDVQVSKAIICNEPDVVPAPDKDQPAPPVDISTLQPATTVETPESVHALLSASSLLNQDVSKIENQSSLDPPVSTQTLVSVPLAPPLPAENFSHGVNFRRQPSVANRDTRSKELLTRHKSAPIPKEDANIPLVTPSLLQMVRLRSVNMTEDAVKAPSEDKTNEGVPPLENSTGLTPGSQNVPQKPIRKSLSLKSPPKTVKMPSVSPNTPSMRLQEAIRMKTAAMSPRDVLPSRLGVRSPPYSFASEHSALSQKSPEGYDMHKSTANTASFIFSRSTKKVIIEPAAATTPQAQASLKQSLAAELMQMTDQSKAVTFSNGGIKSDKVPPPVARKPAHGGNCPSQSLPVCSAKVDFSVGGNGAIGVQNVSGITHPETTTRVTADTIETLF